MKAVWIILVLTVLLVSCTPKQTPPSITITNTTQVTPPARTGAAFGDLATVNFVLSLEDGTVVDTNNEQIAKENKLTNYMIGPYKFILGQSGKVPGFDEAFLGMNVGDHLETTIQPSEKEVILGINKTKIINRLTWLNKRQAFPIEAYNKIFGKPPKKGDIVYSEKMAFKYKVLNLTNETVMAEIYAKEGEKITLPNTEWKSSVVKIAEDDITFLQIPEENQTLKTPFGPATINMTPSKIYINFQPELNLIFNRSTGIGGGFSIPQQFQIVQINDDNFIIKRYGIMADKTLKLTADLLNITEDVREVKEGPNIFEVNSGTEN